MMTGLSCRKRERKRDRERNWSTQSDSEMDAEDLDADDFEGRRRSAKEANDSERKKFENERTDEQQST